MKKAFFFLLIAAVAGLTIWIRLSNRVSLGQAEILGGVVRTEIGDAERLYYLTSQWEKRIFFTSGRASASRKTASSLNIDLWEIDAATAEPLSRRRLKRVEVNLDSTALGMEQGILWARIPELVGIRLADGVIVVDHEKIAQRNPSIAGVFPKPPETFQMLPSSMQPLRFSAEGGMVVRLDDAREVRIDPVTAEATPYIAKKQDAEPPAEAPPAPPRTEVFSPRNGMDWAAMLRGIVLPPNADGKKWIGLLTEPDLAMMLENSALSSQMDFTKPQRSRLYRATLHEETSFMGTKIQHQNPTALPESPEFLMGGLLIQESSDSYTKSVMWRSEPDSVFVLSRDRLGDEGRMQIARISIDKGAPVWSVALPISNLSAWLPGEHHAIILGPDPSAPRSPMAEENDNTAHHILSLDLATGEWKSFNPDLHRDWPIEGSTEKSK